MSFDGGFQAEGGFGSGGGFGQQQSFGSPQQGGGFVQQGGFGGSPATMSQASPSGGGGKKRDAQSLIPITIKQLLEAEQKDSKFKVDGKLLAQITLVGSILSVDAQATNVTYLIDDGTGKVTVRIYVDSDEEPNQQTWSVGSYVRVVGNLRAFNERRSVIGFQLLPITDFNELTFHFLNVIACHLRNTKQAPGAGATPAKAGGAPASSSAFGSSQNQAFTSSDAGQAAGGDGSFNNIQNQVLAVFKADSENDQGTSIDAVFQQLPNIPQADIRNAMTFLSDEGHLYTTIDENHFKSTD
jgi:replication factor A2